MDVEHRVDGFGHKSRTSRGYCVHSCAMDSAYVTGDTVYYMLPREFLRSARIVTKDKLSLAVGTRIFRSIPFVERSHTPEPFSKLIFINYEGRKKYTRYYRLGRKYRCLILILN